ncbi:hypothetical protein BVRB_3g061420 [Beta vulgaris subsp. vulgaris]|uniref:anthranilate N-benzoyltransferase protein 2 n=1 Tax=Beta vulgaris subsp. vulgaris TaxID=3555 RepID=UPI0005402B8A|nr:anthranilate N-benzoyltransferase protein 2 [Beta vulgaris subsp. vulgaris]KMT15438.1 hypothetical protein BVRB_3g061420 [Beta vulgaris subsp. vulgaris]
MSVNMIEYTIVCPAEKTPRDSLWLSCLDLMTPSPNSHSRLLFIYSPSEVENKGSKSFDTHVVKESLSRALVPFYPVAGRLSKNEENGRFQIDCNAAGVLFEEVETTHILADFGDFKPNTQFRKLVLPVCDYSGGLSSFPLLLVRVTRFECGGVCIGFGTHHNVADGNGYSYFINSWARLARGLELDVQPLHNRAVYLAARHPPQVNFQHLEYAPAQPIEGNYGDTEIARECLFKLSKHQIDTLKLKATSQSEEVQSYKLSTYEVLAGHVWRCACKARGLIGDQSIKLIIPIDGRSRLQDPTLPKGYFGNVRFFAACTTKACDITSKPLWHAASKVHEALKNVERTDYLRSAIDYLEMQSDLTNLIRGPRDVNNPFFYINSWGRIPFDEADFGWGKPKFVGHGGIRVQGQAFFVPSPSRDGSFSLSINLSTLHMPLFENYLYDF